MGRIIVALGGNTLLPMEDETMAGQRQRIRDAAGNIAPLVDGEREVVLTHGNGPQVGNLMLQQEESSSGPRFPLDVLVAETQAQIGYTLQQELGNVLDPTVATIVTQVRVDPHDEAFENPTKPVGPFYEEEEARNQAFQTKQVRTNDGRTKYRRVVPSPDPLEIVEADQIRALLDRGTMVICVGGGGIPVVREDGALSGVEAVIDKDRASAVLAGELEAEELLVLTDVSTAFLHFGEPEQEPIRRATTGEMRGYLEDGHFAEGSMRPKVEAAIDFVEGGGERAIITSADEIEDALAGEAGTEIRSG
ncbi:MAG: carbamate kinase [Halodesulfurarchaeum sp.]